MTPNEIKTEFFRRRKDISIAQVADSVGVSRQAVHAVINRLFVSIRIMDAVAEALGKSRVEVFPESINKQKRAC